MREVSWAWGAPALGPGCTDPDSDSPSLGKETIVSRVHSQNISGDSNRGDSGSSPASGDGTSGSSFFPGVGGGGWIQEEDGPCRQIGGEDPSIGHSHPQGSCQMSPLRRSFL